MKGDHSPGRAFPSPGASEQQGRVLQGLLEVSERQAEDPSCRSMQELPTQKGWAKGRTEEGLQLWCDWFIQEAVPIQETQTGLLEPTLQIRQGPGWRLNRSPEPMGKGWGRAPSQAGQENKDPHLWY